MAFWSTASNLVSGDTNGTSDIFVKDLVSGGTTRVSTDTAGVQGNNSSWEPSISGDGRYVAFGSAASNLHPSDTTTTEDVFRVSNFSITASSNLDADGNGRADALTDGILILRYLFDPAGQWNYSDALGSGATRTTRPAIKSYLDGCVTGVLDVDGNGTPDALTDGILILRYLFDPAGQWNYSDALGSGATRTTRTAIKAFLDGYSLGLAPPLGLQTAAFAPEPDKQVEVAFTIDGSKAAPIQTVAAASPAAVDVAKSADGVTVPATAPTNDAIQNSPVVVSVRNDQLIAGVAPAVLQGAAGEETLFGPITAYQESAEPANTRVQDTVLQEWNSPYGYDIPIAPLPASSNSSTLTDDSAALDRLYGEDGLDWFLLPVLTG